MTGPPRELTRSERAAIRRLVTGLCANYDERDKALCIIGEYVNITLADREAGRPHSIRQQLKNNKAPETAAPKKEAKEPER